MRKKYPKPGVYRITNIVSGKIYVGSSSLNIHYRWNDHRSGLRTGRHGNPHLQRAWNKNGEEAFVFDVLEYCTNSLEREQYWIDTLEPEYNICLEAKGSTGAKRSVETCRKIGVSKIGNKNRLGVGFTDEAKSRISKSMKALYANGYVHPLLGTTPSKETLALQSIARKGNSNRRNNPTYRGIEQYALSDQLVAAYTSAREAMNSVGIFRRTDSSKILWACRKPQTRTFAGYKWKFRVDRVKPGELLETPSGTISSQAVQECTEGSTTNSIPPDR